MDDEDEAFRRVARETVGRVKRGDHAAARERLAALLALRTDSWAHENKKAHVLAGAVYDALRQGEVEWASTYLDLHRRRLQDHRLLPTIVDERHAVASLLEHVVRGVSLDACPKPDSLRKVAFVCPDHGVLSPLAAGWTRRLGGADLHVISGGLDPTARRPSSLAPVLTEAGLEVPPPPHAIPEEVLRRFPLVVGLNVSRERVPLQGLPVSRFLPWEVPAPEAWSPDAVRRAEEVVRERVAVLLRTRLGAKP